MYIPTIKISLSETGKICHVSKISTKTRVQPAINSAPFRISEAPYTVLSKTGTGLNPNMTRSRWKFSQLANTLSEDPIYLTNQSTAEVEPDSARASWITADGVNIIRRPQILDSQPSA